MVNLYFQSLPAAIVLEESILLISLVYVLERTSLVRANKRCMHAVRANHDAHGSTLTSRVNTRALNVHFYTIDLSCTCRLFCWIFRNVSSHVVAANVCSQV